MKQIVYAVFFIVTIISLIVVLFTYNQVNREETRLKNDILYRSTLLAESLRETVEPNFISKSDAYLRTVVEKFSTKERFAGLVITDNKGASIVASSTLPNEIPQSQEIINDVMDSDKPNGDFVTFKDRKMYVFAIPLHNELSVVGSLMIVQNAGYIDTRLQEIWRTNLIRLIIQASLLSVATLLIIRWIIYVPIRNLVESLKTSRLSNLPTTLRHLPNNPLFGPLVRELSTLQQNLLEARLSAHEEARLRTEKLDSPWTAQRLQEFMKEILKGRNIFIVSNREPYIHTKNGRTVSFYFPASGMATAIEPIMHACKGTWIAHGSGNADKLVVDKNDRIKVPPDDPLYTLKRVWLTQKEEKGYYYGFSNEGLWPLCHIAHTRPVFRKDDWEWYKIVNGKFAQVVLGEIKSSHRPIILVQDYHLALLARMIKNSRPDAVIGTFWHIPWPNSEAFSICPFRKELLDGMLGSDLIGFHTQLHCNNFIDTIGKELESLIDLEQFAVTRSEHTTYIKPFPISIAFSNGQRYLSHDQSSQLNKNKIRKELNINTRNIGLGVDRLDYTKGILERFKAVDYFIEQNPSYRKNFVLIQIAPPSRSQIESYKIFDQEVDELSESINNKFKTIGWKPIILLKKRYSHRELEQFYQLANICLVTSLHDGMNLVAKEFVASRDDERGVLILSKFAGASRELKEALLVNPYHTEDVAESIKHGLSMMQSEQIRRMRKMRETIRNNNVYRWSAELLKTLVNL